MPSPIAIVRCRREAPAPSAPPRTTATLRVGVLYPCLYVGGAERWLATLIRALPPCRARIAGVWVPPFSENVTPQVAETLGAPIVRDPADLADCDALIVWGVSSAAIPPRFSGPRILVSHGGGTWSEGMLQPLAPHCTHYAAVSETARAAMPRDVRDRATVIPCGVELDRLPATRPRQELRRRLGIQPGQIAVGHVGRWSEEKDPLSAARAVAEVPEAVAVYCGRSLDPEGFRRDVHAIIPPERVRWRSPPDCLGDIYHALDCLMLTSYPEGWGLVIGEAWACGVPTITCRTGVVADTPEELSVIVPAGADGPTLAAAVRQAISPAWRPRVETARRIVWERYSAPLLGERWARLLESAAGRHHSSRTNSV